MPPGPSENVDHRQLATGWVSFDGGQRRARGVEHVELRAVPEHQSLLDPPQAHRHVGVRQLVHLGGRRGSRERVPLEDAVDRGDVVAGAVDSERLDRERRAVVEGRPAGSIPALHRRIRCHDQAAVDRLDPHSLAAESRLGQRRAVEPGQRARGPAVDVAGGLEPQPVFRLRACVRVQVGEPGAVVEAHLRAGPPAGQGLLPGLRLLVDLVPLELRGFPLVRRVGRDREPERHAVDDDVDVRRWHTDGLPAPDREWQVTADGVQQADRHAPTPWGRAGP
jgi:hypothetical protein